VIPSFEKKFSIFSVILQVNYFVGNNIPFNHRSELLPCSWKVVQNVPTSTWNEKQEKHWHPDVVATLNIEEIALERFLYNLEM